MGAYMYPIPVNRKFEIVKYNRVVSLGSDYLTLDKIAKHLKSGETFRISTDEYDEATMTIFGSRIETESERDERVRRAEKYNADRDAFRQKHGLK